MTTPSNQPHKPSWLNRLVSAFVGTTKEEDSGPLFESGFLEKLEKLQPKFIKSAGGGLSGGKRLGSFKGGQLEFHDHRDYSPGDELKYLDWNLFARLEKLYVKEFAREETGVLHILLDGTASMRIGSPSKWKFIRRVAAVFAHTALKSRDQVRLYSYFGNKPSTAFPTTRGGGQRGEPVTSHNLLTYLENQTAGEIYVEDETEPNNNSTQKVKEEWPWAGAVFSFLRTHPPRGNVFLLGDFWDKEEELIAAVSRLRKSGFDVTAIHVMAPEEMKTPIADELRIQSVEEGGHIDLSMSNAEAEVIFSKELEAHRASVEKIVHKHGGRYLFFTSDTSVEQILIKTLRSRGMLE